MFFETDYIFPTIYWNQIQKKDMQSLINKIRWNINFHFIWHQLRHTVLWNTKSKMSWWKIFIDENNDWELQENQENFVITDNTWYYEFNELESWSYNIVQIPHKNWETRKTN